MKKQIELLGMSFPNYSLREEVLLAQEALKDNRLQLFLTVSMHSLMKASSQDVVKYCVENASLVIIDDPEILKVAGINSSQRVREAEDHLFFAEFLKRLVRGHNSVFLVASKDAALEKIEEILSEQYENLDIVGEYSIEQYPDDLDRMINDINGCAPDVIISVMPTPQQEEFLQNNHNKLDAKVWFGLGMHYSLLNEKHGFAWRMKRLIHFGRFKMHVNQYEDKEEK